MNFQYLDSPIGTLRLVSNGTELINIEFEGQYGEDANRESSDAVLVANAIDLLVPDPAYSVYKVQTSWCGGAALPSPMRPFGHKHAVTDRGAQYVFGDVGFWVVV